MEDLIMKIIDIENQAQNLIKDAKTADINLDTDIELQTEKLHKDITNKALIKTETIKQFEDGEADEKIKKIREKMKLELERMEKKRAENKDAWVNDIVGNIVG